jgi:hypothetical protein
MELDKILRKNSNLLGTYGNYLWIQQIVPENVLYKG